jgi:hypothetical protein
VAPMGSLGIRYSQHGDGYRKDTSSDGVTSIRANREYTGPQKPDPVGISLDQEKPAKLAWFSVL